MQSHDSIRNLKHFKRSKQFQNKQLDFGYDADTEDYDAADQTISKIKSQLPDYIKYQQFTDKCDSEDRNITADTGNRDIPETSSQNNDTENQSESVDHKTSAKNQDTEISTEKEDHSNFTTLNTDGDETQTNLSTETATNMVILVRTLFKKLQVRDPYFGPFISYFEQNKLPSSQKAARKLLLETPNYDMVDGLLFHTRTAKCKRTKLFTLYQLALPEVAIKTVLRLYHDSPLGGHGGIQHTADMLKEHYYFPEIITECDGLYEHSEHSENDSPCNDLVSSEHKLSNVPDVSTSENNLPVRRSKRTHRKPMRFRDTNFTTPESSTDSHIKDNVKIKRILACKIVNGTHKYLVHLCGEPAQNARWMDISDLNVKAKEIINKGPRL
ncbi:unnamed protein product [Mytilus coruscus]|uniref:Integrase zinc-binding domain-containing protein n=1 Tax=Mytilus coruscus TaxID=42192 RepID=A0A6J8ATL1_MYTCO|nr:unnamed protein product [Mytilus coruscus]